MELKLLEKLEFESELKSTAIQSQYSRCYQTSRLYRSTVDAYFFRRIFLQFFVLTPQICKFLPIHYEYDDKELYTASHNRPVINFQTYTKTTEKKKTPPHISKPGYKRQTATKLNNFKLITQLLLLGPIVVGSLDISSMPAQRKIASSPKVKRADFRLQSFA